MFGTWICDEVLKMNEDEFMNPPVPPDGNAYFEKDYVTMQRIVCCPWCGKKHFRLNPETVIKNLQFKCKGSNCKRDFIVNT